MSSLEWCPELVGANSQAPCLRDQAIRPTYHAGDSKDMVPVSFNHPNRSFPKSLTPIDGPA